MYLPAFTSLKACAARFCCPELVNIEYIGDGMIFQGFQQLWLAAILLEPITTNARLLNSPTIALHVQHVVLACIFLIQAELFCFRP